VRSKLFILIGACCLSGCGGTLGDPNIRPGTWMPQHDNDANLQAMVANPADLQRGHGNGASMGVVAADAVERLRTGKVRPLPVSGVAEIRPVSDGSNANGGGQ
jgi:hypothetical protein